MRELGRSPSAQDIEGAFRAILDLSLHVTDMAYIRCCLAYLFQAAPKLDEKTFYRHIHLLNANPALKDEAMNIASALIRDSEARGEKIGEARGEKLGQARLLKRQLSSRFGELPGWANEAIDRANLDDLDRWAQSILTAQNLEDVFQHS